MGFKLAIGNRVAVVIKGKIPGDTRGTHTSVNFTLDMDRLDQEQINAAISSGESIADFIVGKTRGWDGQRLVQTEDGNPAPYSEEALRELLKVPGMGVWIWQAYMRDLGVQEKN